ncbi:MAG TPA: regulatory protein RecX [Thermoanaerobaculia bacterium]|nr:regulatory protein RecX [Thermoanaerobaculia bacterium]
MPLNKKKPVEPDDVLACYEAAMHLLRFRFRSIVELQRALAQKGYSQDPIAEVIERLVRERWLDDARFAESFSRSRLRKSYGKLRVEKELSAFGVSAEVQKSALAAAAADHPEQEGLNGALKKKVRTLVSRHGEAYTATEEGRKKLMSYLLSRGYDHAAILTAVKKLKIEN